MSDEDAITRLREAVRASGSPLADIMDASPAAYAGADGLDPVALAASGPRVADNRAVVELAVIAVLEGCLLHYGEPQVLQIADPDLALLAGDRLYALGLAQLAAIGDLDRDRRARRHHRAQRAGPRLRRRRARARRVARRRGGDRLGRGRADGRRKGPRAQRRCGLRGGAARRRGAGQTLRQVCNTAHSRGRGAPPECAGQ